MVGLAGFEPARQRKSPEYACALLKPCAFKAHKSRNTKAFHAVRCDPFGTQLTLVSETTEKPLSMKPLPNAVELDVDAIKPFIRRAREQEGFEHLKASIKEIGLKIPIQVRDISDRRPEKRKRPDGGHYRFELICGQGRLEAHRQLKIAKIPALVINAPEVEVAGRFLAENILRKPLPWPERARLVQADLSAGMSLEAVAKKFFIHQKTALKYQRVISGVAVNLQDELVTMLLSDAEKLVTLPPSHQSIVISVMRETGQKAVRAMVSKAMEIKDESGGKLSKSALKASLSRVSDDLKRLRDKLKLTRLHESLGPANLETMLRNPKIRKAFQAHRVNLKQFEDLCK